MNEQKTQERKGIVCPYYVFQFKCIESGKETFCNQHPTHCPKLKKEVIK